MKSLAMLTSHKLHIVCLLALVVTGVRADDSLQSLYRSHHKIIKTTDTARIVESYKYLGDYLSETGDFEKSELYLTKGLQIAYKAKLTRETGIIHNLLASNASYNGNRPMAISHYHKALKAFADIKDLDKVAMVMMNMGSEYEFSGDMQKAIAYELKALKNKEASGVRKNLDYYYQNIGQLFKETNTEKWKYYVEKAYEVSKTLPESRIQTKAAIFNDLGGIARQENNIKAAFAWYDSMLIISQEAEYLNGMGTAYSNRSLLYLAEKQYDKALRDILEAIKISDKTGRNYSKIVDKIHAANILVEMNRTDEAKLQASEALQLTQTLKYYPEEEAAAHLALARIGEKTKDWRLAYENYSAYKEGTDSLRNADVQKNMHKLETKYQTAEKEKQIAHLADLNKLNKVKLDRQNILIVTLIIIMLLTVGVIVLLNTRRQLRNQKLQAELKQKLLRSQMNPHFIFNTLNAINQYIQTNKSHEASDYLAQYSKLMRQILENSAVELISLDAEIAFLHNYMAMQQLRFNNSFAYSIETSELIQAEDFEIPPMIAQPFIENAIEHGVRGVANAEIKIKFTYNEKKLNLTVADNGKGFKATSANLNHKSFALDITRERLNIDQNNTEKLQILSPNPESGTGTLVSIEIPFKHYKD